jgi:pimeloyl-ACP methyl ester carboxylesterase
MYSIIKILFLTPCIAIIYMLWELNGILYPSVDQIITNWNETWGKHNDEFNTIPFSIPIDIPLPHVEFDKFLNNKLKFASPSDWSQGLNQNELLKYVQHWNTTYSINKQMMRLNLLGAHYHTVINGLKIHYIRCNSTYESGIPLLLLHGWPGMFTEFAEVFPLLCLKGYNVLLPSLPGYGFSEAPLSSEFTFIDAAVIFAKLVHQLFPNKKYVCQGGDWGSFVCSALAQIDTVNVLGIHLNMPMVAIPPKNVGSLLVWPWMMLFPDEKIGSLIPFFKRIVKQTAYLYLQATQPDLIGLGLNSSPIFLLAWILDKFKAWSKEDLAMNDILDVVTIYWLTQATSGTRWYYGVTQSRSAQISLLAPIPVPVALIDTPFEIYRIPTSWLQGYRYPYLKKYTEAKHGGHFYALEYPTLLVENLIEFIHGLNIKN